MTCDRPRVWDGKYRSILAHIVSETVQEDGIKAHATRQNPLVAAFDSFLLVHDELASARLLRLIPSGCSVSSPHDNEVDGGFETRAELEADDALLALFLVREANERHGDAPRLLVIEDHRR